MESKFRFDLKKFLLGVAAVTAVVSVVILFFFKNEMFSDFFSLIKGILKPFIYGGVIAYLLRPVCLRIENTIYALKRKAREKKEGRKPAKKTEVSAEAAGEVHAEKKSGLVRGISITLGVIILFVIIILLLYAVIPGVISGITSLVSQIQPAFERFQNWISTLDQTNLSSEIIESINNAVETITTWVESFLSTDLLPTLQTAITEITSSFLVLLDILKNFGIGCIVAIYLLADWERFIDRAKLIIYGVFPVRIADWIKNEIKIADSMFGGFISGKIIDSFIMGVICFAFMSLFNMPYSMLISVLIGVFNIIPFFGPYIGTIPSVLMLLTESTSACIVFLIFIIILQQFDGNVLGPKILGDKIGLSGFWILFAIMFFGGLWGFVGLLIGVPLFGVIYDLGRRFIYGKLRKKDEEELIEGYEAKYKS